MDFELSPDHDMIRRTVRDFLTIGEGGDEVQQMVIARALGA